MYAAIRNNIIQAVSNNRFEMQGCFIVKGENLDSKSVGAKYEHYNKKNMSELKIAFVGGWGIQCGLSTYFRFLFDKMRPKVKEIQVFSEITATLIEKDESYVVRNWKRGESFSELALALNRGNFDLIFINMEFGYFNGFFWLKLLEEIENLPYFVILHSVYRTHFDKTCLTVPIKKIIVHTEQCKGILRETGHLNDIFVVPHGIQDLGSVGKLFNTFYNPEVCMSFGFAFEYKSIETCIYAIKELIDKYSQHKNIRYIYLATTTNRFDNIHFEYVKKLRILVKELSLDKNITILQGFFDDKIINNFLRTTKLAIFSYKKTEEEGVYGASGAARIAISNRTPTILSGNCNQFLEFKGICPLPTNSTEMAEEIHKIFFDWKYKDKIIEKQDIYIKENNWEVISKKFLNLYNVFI